MKICSFFLLLLSSLSLFGEEEIEVRLRAKDDLASVYIGAVSKEDPQFSDLFVQQIESLLKFDLNQSGFSYVLEENPEKEKKCKMLEGSTPLDIALYSKENTRFIVKPSLITHALSLLILDTQKQTLKRFASSNLTGEIAADREKIHLMLSHLQKELFGVEGIFHKKILYSHRTTTEENSSNWVSEIWVCDFDGKNARQLTHDKGYSISPRFINGKPGSFIYVSYKLGQSKIFLSSVKEKESWIPLRGNQALPCMSQSADQVAFICDAAGRPDLFIQNINAKGDLLGKPKQIFSFPRATQASPTFHPNGKKIAFVSDKDGPPRIYTLDLALAKGNETPKVDLVTKKNRQNTSPSWSPDGTKLAYSAKTDDVRQIWIYDFEKNEEFQITFGNKNMENPFWAQDSIHVIFNSEDEISSDLYIVNIYQPEPVKITEGNGQKRFPCWEY